MNLASGRYSAFTSLGCRGHSPSAAWHPPVRELHRTSVSWSIRAAEHRGEQLCFRSHQAFVPKRLIHFSLTVTLCVNERSLSTLAQFLPWLRAISSHCLMTLVTQLCWESVLLLVELLPSPQDQGSLLEKGRTLSEHHLPHICKSKPFNCCLNKRDFLRPLPTCRIYNSGECCSFPGSSTHSLELLHYRPSMTSAYFLHHILEKKDLVPCTFCCVTGVKNTIKCGTTSNLECFIPNLKIIKFYLICMQSNMQITFHGN